MPGRPKKRVYEYSEDGKFIQTYECENDVRRKYYSRDRGNRPLWRENANYHKLSNGNFITQERIGRVGINEINRRLKCDFLKIDHSSKPINCYNIDGVKIATFVDFKAAYKLTKIPATTIYHQLNSRITDFTDRGIIFSYK